jgi:hypothetical protein
MALVASPSTARNVPDGPPFVLPGGAALQTAAVPSADEPATRLLRVTADDPEYRRLAAAEAAFWRQMHPMGLEATEHEYSDGPIDRYVNTRFTGDPDTTWTRCRYGRRPRSRSR